MLSIKEIADFLNLKVENVVESAVLESDIVGAKPLSEAGQGDVSLCRKGLMDYADVLGQSGASLVIVDRGVRLPGDFGVPVIFSDNARLSFMQVLAEFFEKKYEPKIHESAVICDSVRIGENVFIGAGCTIGEGSVIGDNCVIHAGVHIYDNVKIGNNVVIHSATVIGCDGFGFERDENNEIVKFPHIGGVRICDDVEIMASVNICKGTLADTVIGEGSKIDSGVFIAHNVQIGKRCLIVAHALVAGSAKIGDDVYIAPCSSVINKIEVGDGAFIGMNSFVNKDVPANVKAWGVPAKVEG